MHIYLDIYPYPNVSNALGTSCVLFIILGENKIYFIIILLVNKYLKMLFQPTKKKS